MTALASMVASVAHRDLSLEALCAWGRAVGEIVPTGSIIALRGPMGAGKTTLVRALCEGRGAVDLSAVTSPTYSILHWYQAPRGTIVHADLYRLSTPAELAPIGFDEAIAGADLVCIEWPEIAQTSLPRDVMDLTLAYAPANGEARRVCLTGDVP